MVAVGLYDFMMSRLAIKNRLIKTAGFTLIETLMAFFIFGLVSAGVIYGYVQSNAMAEWSSISLAAESYAIQGAEQARAAKWEPWAFPQNSSTDQLHAPTNYVNSGMNYIFELPIKGSPTAPNFAFFVTNYVSVSNIMNNPPLRQITSQVVWTFYLTGR